VATSPPNQLRLESYTHSIVELCCWAYAGSRVSSGTAMRFLCCLTGVHCSKSCSIRIHLQPVACMTGEQNSVERSVMRLTKRQYVAQIRAMASAPRWSDGVCEFTIAESELGGEKRSRFQGIPRSPPQFRIHIDYAGMSNYELYQPNIRLLPYQLPLRTRRSVRLGLRLVPHPSGP
jgi:hypothetical protein